MSATKQFSIPKGLVWRAYQLVKANRGSAGVDQQSLEAFELKLKDNLYKIWNRMSSGCYMPPAVKAVPIPKKSGGVRVLGVPTVADRIAQMVVKLVFEPPVELAFLPDSYGYRPGKSALDAIGATRERCRRWDWVLEFDIVGLFDNIPHDLLLKAVRKHTSMKWVALYIERWLRAPMEYPDGRHEARTRGTPQGGVISPVLANLFLHYAFDVWMSRTHIGRPWCRYADDGLIHCESESQALALKDSLQRRLSECGLEMHSDKTRIVYCKDDRRGGTYPRTEFDFLGYTFRRRVVRLRRPTRFFVSFNPAVSKASSKAMRAQVRRSGIRRRSDLGLQDIAQLFNPILRGWMNYYGSYRRSELYPVLRHFNLALVAWAMAKYKGFRGRKTRASRWLMKISKRDSSLFAHWQAGMVGTFI
jgi:group II intron reverse transcriptase/maturase